MAKPLVILERRVGPAGAVGLAQGHSLPARARLGALTRRRWHLRYVFRAVSKRSAMLARG